MRQWIALVAFGALLAMPCPTPAADDEEQPIGVEPTEVEPGDVLQPAEKQASKERAPRAQPAQPTKRKLPAEPTEEELLDEHMDAIRDYQEAETDEQAEKAQKRFNDAEARELKLQRDRLEHAIER